MKTARGAVSGSAGVLRAYYAATLLFVVLDYALGINVSLAFLEASDELRALYYLLCFACLPSSCGSRHGAGG